MKDGTYNGWTNRATWNAYLWLWNNEFEYSTYSILISRAERQRSSAVELAKQIQDYCEQVWPNGLTPDGDLLAQVNWLEIAQSELE